MKMLMVIVLAIVCCVIWFSLGYIIANAIPRKVHGKFIILQKGEEPPKVKIDMSYPIENVSNHQVLVFKVYKTEEIYDEERSGDGKLGLEHDRMDELRKGC